MARKDVKRSELLSGITNNIFDLTSHLLAPQIEGRMARQRLDCDEWLTALDTLRDMHPRRVKRRGDKLRSNCSIRTVDANGDIVLECRGSYRVERQQLSLDLEYDDLHRACCTCDVSRDELKCEHTYAAACYLIDELKRDEDMLAALIHGNSQDASPFELLDSFLASRPTAGEDGEEDPRGEEQSARLIWRVAATDRVSIEPLQQRKRKRGTGWTKGARVSLEKLLTTPELIQSPSDAKACQAITRSNSYYSYSEHYTINCYEALEALVGHDLVFLEGKPAQVILASLRITVAEVEDQFILDLEFVGAKGEFDIYPCEEGLIACDLSQGSILVCPCDDGEQELAETLFTRAVSFPIHSRDQLLARLTEISKVTTVDFPESLVGPAVKDATRIVARLRSRHSGHLECGIRVKNAAGTLHEPGQGVMCVVDELDGQPRQLLRNPTDEVERARRAAHDLRLRDAHQLSTWDWRFLEFDQALEFLERFEKEHQRLEIEALWDSRSTESLRVVGTVTASNVRVEVSKKRDWFGLQGSCRVGEQEYPLGELLAAIRSEPAEGYLEIQPGHWAKISQELREKLKQLQEVSHLRRNSLEIGPTAAPVFQELLEAQIDFEAPSAWRQCLERLDRARGLTPDAPAGFVGELRDYQLDGYRWLRRLAEWGVGGCLADDMGLGKTIQALAVLLDRAANGPALIIAPTSVGFNWVRETERFTPDLTVHSYRETERAEFLPRATVGDVVVCSYGLALRDAAALSKVNWGTLVLDEAQFVKNSRSKTSQAIRQIPAEWTLALTGTPIENHLGELWSLFRIISPGLFGSWEQFRARFAGPIEKSHDEESRLALSRVIRPFVLRRTKSEVLTELPPRTEANLYVDLSPAESQAYDEMRLAALGELAGGDGAPDTEDQRFRVLAMLTRMRQIACHVGLVDKTWKGTSAKLRLLSETLLELRDEGHRVLVFSQFTQYLALIRSTCDQNGITYEYLDGSTPAKARQQRVDRFQEGNADVFLISLKAGGTGLNLTAADYVIHMDPWWNPAVESQATDRAHRIGQTKPVIVYRIVARGTIEEQILDLHDEKRDLVSGVMDGTGKAAELSTADLISLIRGVSSSV